MWAVVSTTHAHIWNKLIGNFNSSNGCNDNIRMVVDVVEVGVNSNSSSSNSNSSDSGSIAIFFG